MMSSSDATQVISFSTSVFLVPQEGDRIEIVAEQYAGRSEESDIVLDDPNASRKHARVWPEGGKLMVEDLQSTNGSQLNGEAQTGTFSCQHGDVLSFAKTEFKVLVVADVPTQNPDANKTQVIDVSNDSVAAEPVGNEESANELQAPKVELEQKSPVEAVATENKQAQQAPAQTNESEPSDNANAESETAHSKKWWEGEKPKTSTELVDISQLDENLVALLSIEPPTKPRLVVRSGTDSGQTFDLDGESTLIGTAQNCDFVLSDTTVSSEHAKIEFEAGTWRLRDILALNQSVVNDEKVKSVYLSHGDHIRLGNSVLLFQLPESDAKKTKRSAPAGIVIGVGLIVLFAALVTWYTMAK